MTFRVRQLREGLSRKGSPTVDGANAFRAGAKASDNPYWMGLKAVLWAKGWRAARDDAEKHPSPARERTHQERTEA